MKENIELAAQLATIVSLLAAVWAIINAAKSQRRMFNMEVFTRYTERFESVVSDFPASSFENRFADSPDAFSPELRKSIIKYLNLVSEEYYLWKRGYLDKGVWTIWEDEIKKTIASNLFVRDWPQVRDEFQSFPGFIEYVESTQK